MKPTPRVIAVVVAWNGGDALDRCLASLRADADPEIILVDNGSATAEQERVAARYGNAARVQLLRGAHNAGFAEGTNIGLRRALAQGAEMMLVVTQDVTVEPGTIDALVAALAANSKAGIIGPLVLDARRPERELSRGERVAPPFLCVPRTLLRRRRQRGVAYEVSGVLGCLFLISRACAEATGGFDPAFFAYYEEVDLCLRAQRLGFRILCEPRAHVFHDRFRGFMQGFTPLSAELKARNLICLRRKHGSPSSAVVFWPTYAALLASSALLYLARGRMDIVRALARGALAGWQGRAGALAPDGAAQVR